MGRFSVLLSKLSRARKLYKYYVDDDYFLLPITYTCL